MKAEITRKPVNAQRVIGSVSSDAGGCKVVFIGTVRNRSDGRRVTGMELESAEDLARKDLLRIARETASRFDIEGIAVTHRVGRLRVGDTIVTIAVCAAHRRDAFGACQHVIDELKKTTPIWKKELSGKKGRWVKSGD